MRCLVVTSGALSLAPDGAVCAPTDLVAFTSEEAAQYANSPFNLTLEQGAEIGGAILLVWAVAFSIRAIARTLADTARVLGDE